MVQQQPCIIELLPHGLDGRPVVRRSEAPRDLASSVLLALICTYTVVEVLLGISAGCVTGIHLRDGGGCLLTPTRVSSHHTCYLVVVAVGLTVPVAAGILLAELLPPRLVSPGVRNLLPLALTIVGTAVWGVVAAALHHQQELDDQARQEAASAWRGSVESLAWATFAFFLASCLQLLLQPLLLPCIDRASVHLGRWMCPETCLPSCDACCGLSAALAKVPREVTKQGQVVLRFLQWDQETVHAPGAVACMQR